MRYSILILAAAVVATSLYAQDSDASVQGLIRAYNGQKGKLLGGAQAMSDADYAMKPGEGSRTFAEVVGHLADAQATTCGAVAGTPTQLNAERGMKTKAELVAALEKSFELCDAAYSGTTAANHDATMTAGFGGPQPRNVILWNNVSHSEEMYGTMSVYLRSKGIVPPSTAARANAGKGKGAPGGGKGK
jgi:uncharacterized damage-inducible protein DinB